MLLGKVLAAAAMEENKFVTWLPAYGAEVRGGAAYCMVIVSSREIGSPYIDKADVLIVMNQPSFVKFQDRVRARGLLILNGSLVEKHANKKLDILQYPFTDIAVELGNIKIANMVALGCFLSKRKIMSMRSILQAIEKIAPADKKDLVAINQQAVLKGMELEVNSK